MLNGVCLHLSKLSEFDVERCFALTDSDVAAVNERFRRDRRSEGLRVGWDA
jgi:hypothetical protein